MKKSPEINPHTYGQFFTSWATRESLWSINLLQKRQEYTVGEKTVSSINGARKTGQLHANKMKLEYSLTPYRKINSKWIKDANLRFVFSCENISRCFPMLEDSIAKTLVDMNCGNIFLDPLPRVMKINTKTNKWD